jgi:phage shock protein C
MDKKLQRKEGKVLGVCAGLGEYLDIDPTVVRIGFVLSAIFMGIGIIPYIILALVMPKA